MLTVVFVKLAVLPSVNLVIRNSDKQSYTNLINQNHVFIPSNNYLKTHTFGILLTNIWMYPSFK